MRRAPRSGPQPTRCRRPRPRSPENPGTAAGRTSPQRALRTGERRAGASGVGEVGARRVGAAMADYRFVWTPRWIAGHLLALFLVVLMASLGFWQLRRL